MTKFPKPLGRKNYGSIGHIATSRLGENDYQVDPGQTDICTINAKGNIVYVQTKLDGANVGVAKLPNGKIVGLTRKGYLLTDSTYEVHHSFHYWLKDNENIFANILMPGQRVVGEWLAMAHGTIYNLHGRSPFVAFDIMSESDRMTYENFIKNIDGQLATPDTIQGPIQPKEALKFLDSYGAQIPEGVVYRVEKKNKVSFLAKWVRQGKEDGKYMKLDEPIWNWTP